MTHGYSAQRRGFPPVAHFVLATILLVALVVPKNEDVAEVDTTATYMTTPTEATVVETTEATAETVTEETVEETVTDTVKDIVYDPPVIGPEIFDGSVPTESLPLVGDPDLTGEMIPDLQNDDTFLYYTGFTDEAVPTEPAAEGQIKIACVGDSLTYGYGIQDWLINNYPAQLQDSLGESYHVQNFGSSGSSVQEGTSRSYTDQEAYGNSLAYEADVVIFMMGSNDTKEANWLGEEAFKAALCQLLDSYGDVQIILCTPAACVDAVEEAGDSLDYDLRPEYIEIVAEIVREVAAERNYPLVDIYKLTENRSELFAIDGIHPNKDGATVIAEAVYEAVSALELA